ncbi:MAG: SDR family oxidoreductase [Desulfobacterales bacterium]|jgi:NAD(P)-dependent dehydrogenase (short-subunit alcohol dehydrogenase family)|nr:SDR family oxidoreductase [Desulfobacterales bacterium]
MSGLFDLDGEVGVVTGALGKLGPIWVETLLEAGARVLALDRPGQPASAEFKRVQARFGPERLQADCADVCSRPELEAALARCREAFGPPSVLVNNAGIDAPPAAGGKRFRLEEIPLDVNLRILEVNAAGLFLVTQVFGAAMAANRRGAIINIGSLYASVSPDARFYDHIPGDPPFIKPPAYGASKAAVVNLTKYLAAHLAPHGVRVNALSPGGVLGGQDEEFQRKFCARVPLGRMATDEDLRGPLLFLASPASAYVTGINLKVDGGFTLW